MPPIPWLYISAISGQGTWIFVANSFIPHLTVDLLTVTDSTVTDHWSNHLQLETFSVNWYLYSLLFICLCDFIFGIPMHSSSTNIIQFFLKKLDDKNRLLKKVSKKMVQSVSSRHSVKARTPWGPNFSSLFLSLYPSSIELVPIFCLISAAVPKFKPPFYWYFVHELRHTWYSIKFDHLFINNLSRVIGNTGRENVIEGAYYRSKFIGLVSFSSFWLSTKYKVVNF